MAQRSKHRQAQAQKKAVAHYRRGLDEMQRHEAMVFMPPPEVEEKKLPPLSAGCLKLRERGLTRELMERIRRA